MAVKLGDYSVPYLYRFLKKADLIFIGIYKSDVYKIIKNLSRWEVT